VWPIAARAQRQLPVIGILNSGAVEPRRDQIEWFQRGLKEAGFAEGENVIIVKRGADDHYDRLPALAAELVRQQVAVIATVGGPVAALAAKTATATAQSMMRSKKWSWLKAWAMQIARRRGMKKAIVALARRLAVIMHRMWVDGTEFRWTREHAAAAA
jgi:phage FluMu protein gp41